MEARLGEDEEGGARMRTRDAHGNHLDMALLELALYAVEVGSVEVVLVAIVLDDIVVDGALFEGARLVGLLLVLVPFGHGWRRRKEGERRGKREGGRGDAANLDAWREEEARGRANELGAYIFPEQLWQPLPATGIGARISWTRARCPYADMAEISPRCSSCQRPITSD